MSTLNRRDFLKVLGVSGTSTLAACELADPRVPYEHVLPYVVVPDQIVPGVATWFASQCTGCDAGCGILARNREGRVVKLEGNPDHPTNQGKLCTRGQATIQGTYSPDRFAGPMKAGVASDWDGAIKAVTEAITAAKSSGKTIAWIGQYRTGSLAALIAQFVGAVGGKVIHWEALGYESLRAASLAVFGKDSIPAWHLDDARTILSFGADFLATWLSPVAQTLAYANSRDPKLGGFVSRHVTIAPRIGSSSAVTDVHLAPVPGTEVGVALAIAKLLADRNGYAGPAAALLSGVDVGAAAAASGLSEEKLAEIAGWLAEGPSAVLPGGVDTSADPTGLATAALLLNEVAGNIGRTVVFGPEHNTAGQGSYADIAAVLADAASGRLGVLFLDGVDLAYALPGELKARETLEKVENLIVFTDEPTDSVTANALALPPGTGLETWGDSESIRGRYTLQQPSMSPLKDSRSIGDVLLSLAAALKLPDPVVATPAEPPAEAPAEPARKGGVKGAPEVEPAPVVVADPLPGFSAKSYRDYVAAWWKAVVWPLSGRTEDFASFWTASLQRGGYFHAIAPEGAACVLGALPAAAAATPAGDDPVLALFPHPFLHDGRNANRPWAQEVPEPVSTYTWGTWAEINPETAEHLGLAKEDSVVVETAHGRIEVAWFGSPGIRKDTVAVVMGNGHSNAGRYARYGMNPNHLLPARVDAASGGLSFLSTRATVRRSGNKTTMHILAGNMTQDNRGLNHTTYVGDLEHASGPGSAVHAHEVPVDERVEDMLARGGMYPEPEHPTYRFAMSVDLNRCTGCGACEAACFAENNIPVVGPDQIRKSRHMGWIRLSRYWEGSGEHPDVRFQPVMCQQCAHAPCEGVCPVLATYHNLDGLNAMVYNRCVGTRYCANNCPYTARRFNYHTFTWPEPFHMMLNPDVSTREMGVMEKCTFCLQRIREAKDTWRDRKEVVPDNALVKLTACAQACPADAIVFGNLKDPDSKVAKTFEDPRAYTMLRELNTKSGVRYLARITHAEKTASAAHGEGGHH